MTIRTHLEAIPELINQNRLWQAKEHAVAALRILDNAFWHEDLGRSEMCRLVPDPVGERDAKEPEGSS